MELQENMLETYTSFELSLNAKGFVQWVIKAKYPSTEQATQELSKSIDLLNQTLKEKNLIQAGGQ